MPRTSEKTERGFRYQQRTKENVRDRANARGGDFDTIFKSQFKIFKPKDGKNIVRILPPTWDDPEHYGYDIHINYGIGVDNQSYLSLHKMKQEKDPLAEAKREAERAGDKDTAKALTPNKRILMWVIDRHDEDEGPLLWAAPFTVDKAFANLSFDEDTKEVVYIDHPEEGRDVRFYKEGEGMKTKYDASKMKLLATTPIHQDEGLQQDWLDFITDNPLPSVLQFYDYDHIATIFDGQVRTNADDEDVIPAPRGRARVEDEADAPPPRRRPVVEENDAPPARSGRSRIEAEPELETRPARRRPVVDPDDEVDAPPPRRRAAVADPIDPDDEPHDPKTGELSPRGASIRDRLRSRRRPAPDED